MPIFEYDDAAITHLSRKDKKLGAAMAAIGRIEREVTPDPFQALVTSVISQQRAEWFIDKKHLCYCGLYCENCAVMAKVTPAAKTLYMDAWAQLQDGRREKRFAYGAEK